MSASAIHSLSLSKTHYFGGYQQPNLNIFHSYLEMKTSKSGNNSCFVQPESVYFLLSILAVYGLSLILVISSYVYQMVTARFSNSEITNHIKHPHMFLILLAISVCWAFFLLAIKLPQLVIFEWLFVSMKLIQMVVIFYLVAVKQRTMNDSFTDQKSISESSLVTGNYGKIYFDQ